MLLAVDVGNTETLVALFRGRELLHQWRLTSGGERTGDEIAVSLHALLATEGHTPGDLSGIAVSSVVPGLTSQYRQIGRRFLGRDAFIIDHRAVPGLPIRVHDPESVGADRLVNAIAARSDYGFPSIVVDLGTATTFDVLDADGAYAGGVIAPGVATSANALFQRGARLARVEIVRPERVVGRSTMASIQSGVFFGAVGAVDALVRAIIREQEFPESIPVIATGGLASLVAEVSVTITDVDEPLTVRGILQVWQEAGSP